MDYIFSLIIPHYNIPESLKRLLHTIPHRSDLQVIVVDDCSTNNRDELNKLKDEYSWVEWYDTEINGGGGKARNIGLKHAKGKFLIFADADDLFNLCFNEVLNEYRDTNYDLVYFAANSIDTENYQNSNRDSAITPLVHKFLKTRNPIDIKHKFTAPWCKLISTELVRSNNIQFQESIVYNDMLFSEQVDFYSKNISADCHAIYCVTTRKNSVSSVGNPSKEVEKMKVVANYYKYALDNKIPVVSLRNLIGPMLVALNNHEYKNYRNEGINYFEKIGITRHQIYRDFFFYRIYQQILIPGNNIFKMLKSMLHIKSRH